MFVPIFSGLLFTSKVLPLIYIWRLFSYNTSLYLGFAHSYVVSVSSSSMLISATVSDLDTPQFSAPAISSSVPASAVSPVSPCYTFAWCIQEACKMRLSRVLISTGPPWRRGRSGNPPTIWMSTGNREMFASMTRDIRTPQLVSTLQSKTLPMGFDKRGEVRKTCAFLNLQAWFPCKITFGFPLCTKASTSLGTSTRSIPSDGCSHITTSTVPSPISYSAWSSQRPEGLHRSNPSAWQFKLRSR